MPFLATGGAFVLAALVGGVGYRLVSGEEPPVPAPTPTASTNFFAADWPDITTTPDPCATVSQATLAQVAAGGPGRPGGTGQNGCIESTRYRAWDSSGGGRDRTLTIFLTVHRSQGVTTGAAAMSGQFASQFRQHSAQVRSTANPNLKSGSVKRLGGIGSEAYYDYRVFRGEDVGEFANIDLYARVRNVLVQVRLEGSDNPSGWAGGDVGPATVGEAAVGAGGPA